MVQPELTEEEFSKNVTPIVQVRPAEKVLHKVFAILLSNKIKKLVNLEINVEQLHL